MVHYVQRRRGKAVYGYWERSYRVPGQKNPKKEIVAYLGRVDGETDSMGRRRKKGLAGKISDAITHKYEPETEEQRQARLRVFFEEKIRTMRNNELLSKMTISLQEMNEIAASQNQRKEEAKVEPSFKAPRALTWQEIAEREGVSLSDTTPSEPSEKDGRGNETPQTDEGRGA